MGTQDGRLIWIDLEMTGLDSQRDSIIEIATVVTDTSLETIAEGPVLAINQADTVLQAMDDWNTRQHSRSGLTDRVRASQSTMAEAEHATLEFLQQHVAPKAVHLCVVTASVKTGASWPEKCPCWRHFSITVTWTSVR